ncbi:MAG: TIGR02206 family membrane protein [Oscillospiraceae bacterium]|nr:TIGR02206 family membrane protein [Oscillospiraceae bacterium]
MENFFVLENRLPAGAGFATFGREHICWLLIAAALGAALCMAFRRAGRRGQARLRVAVGCMILLCELLKDANLLAQGVFDIYYLPLHLCGIAVFFSLYHSLRPGEVIGNFLYSTCMPGAFCALLFPDWTAYPAFSYHSIVAFLVHTLLTVYPLMLLCGGAFRPNRRRLPACFLLLLSLAVPIYVFDRIFQANYMFLLQPSPGSPLEWFASFLGNPGYLLGYLPMLAVIWAALYFPFRHRERDSSMDV